MAHGELARRGRRDVLLQTTMLVDEAYIKLFGSSQTEWKDRRHFFGAARNAMRQLLFDWARGKDADKRGGGEAPVTLGEWIPSARGTSIDAMALHLALEKLAELDPRQAQVVEYKCLLGLSNPDTAKLLDVSERTIALDWQHAKAWLKRELES